jgi:hypothetical protein|nr:MAG TPA: hypothetical protein [Caudoviricetes sp.]
MAVFGCFSGMIGAFEGLRQAYRGVSRGMEKFSGDIWNSFASHIRGLRLKTGHLEQNRRFAYTFRGKYRKNRLKNY